MGTLAVMLPMLAATTPLGHISWDDVALSWMIQGLPRVRELEASLLAAGGPDLGGALPAAGLRPLTSASSRCASAIRAPTGTCSTLFAVRHGAGILVLDEPTAWLDARGEADFFDRFLEITAGTTTLIISHRFSTVRRADHICVLDGGG